MTTRFKFYLVLCFFIGIFSSIDAVKLSISNTAGNLTQNLPNAVYSNCVATSEVSSFSIYGTVNAADFSSLSGVKSASFNKLDTIDLSNAILQPSTIDGTYYDSYYLPPNSFDGFRTLSTVFLPNNIKIIGYKAFAGCSALKQFPNSVEEIKDQSFAWARALGTAVTSTSLKKVGNNAFGWCDNVTGDIGLNVITFPSTQLTQFGFGVFENDNQLTDIYMYATTPPFVGSDGQYNGSFGSNIGKNGVKPTLHVPASAVAAYQAISAYNSVFNIQSL